MTAFLPALQVEQVKRGCFEAIYEDNACLFKPYSNDQNGKSVLEFLFVKASQNVFWQEKTLQDIFTGGAQLSDRLISDCLDENTEWLRPFTTEGNRRTGHRNQMP